MVGRGLDRTKGLRGEVKIETQAPMLEVRGLRTTRYPEYPIDLVVRRGEIVAMAGLVGAGRTELLRAIFGIDRPVAGSISIEGEEVQVRHPADAAAAGIAFVPEDRKADGLLLEEPIGENMTLPSLSSYATGGILRHRGRERAVAKELIHRMDVRPAESDLMAGGLSGGNQQKVAVGRWVGCGPRVFLLDEPTRGVDVAAKAEIHLLLDRLAQDGAAILAASSEMEELLAVSDRVVVLHEGRIVGDLARHEASEAAIMQLATGGDREGATSR
jgi:ribose transport system ATP-binding protein